jgi:hypothetical protein
VFFVSGYTRPSNERSIYNLSYPVKGVPLSYDDEKQATVPAFVFPPVSTMTNLYESRFVSWPSSKRARDAMNELSSSRIDKWGPVYKMPANIQADDILEPRWIEDSSHPVQSLGLACIVCPEKNGTEPFPQWHCSSFDTGNITEFYLPIELLSVGGAGIEVRMPSSRSFETIAACAFHLNFSTPSGADVVVSSRVFFVADGSSMRDEQHRFNLTQVSGAPTGLHRGVLSESKSTDFYSSFGSSHNLAGEKKLSPGAIAGVALGSIFGSILVFWLCKRCNRKARKKDRPSSAERDAAARGEAGVYLAPRLRGERAASTSSPRLGARASQDRVEVTRAEDNAGEIVAKPPPAYHEVVTDQHHMVAQCQIVQNVQPVPTDRR